MLRVPPAPVPQVADRVDHRGYDLGVLAHAKIVVRAPDGDLPHVIPVPVRFRKGAAAAFKIGEGAVVAFGLERVELALEVASKVHRGHFLDNSVGSVAAGLSGSIQRQSFWSGRGSTMNQCSRSASGGQHGKQDMADQRGLGRGCPGPLQPAGDGEGQQGDRDREHRSSSAHGGNGWPDAPGAVAGIRYGCAARRRRGSAWPRAGQRTAARRSKGQRGWQQSSAA